ncbi:rhamnogalacturonan lyase B N-terminal domain-containing protein [Pseudoduganella namucuonensis]|uniref:rhamnogalacturonan endolyase n=1 Tax=Pseudoduganella namucuonensis TaxID=1035707 RepID=A0A1I7KN75_9BURK|nr:rhamnogalacturonan lyase B N-terminal domain-containing protein [Pseudoduganella namucuonensis]SFU98850.1 rhamnogalacturonan endolyase [Pseudoduganella namucuonensis]
MTTQHLKTSIATLPLLTLLALLAGCGGGETAGDTASGPTAKRMGAPEAGTFGLSEDANFYTVDTGAGLVFKIRRLDNGVSTQSAGDIASMIYNGVQYQDASRGSQVNSGFDFLYTGVSAVSVTAAVVGTEHVKVTVKAGDLTHYYIVKKGVNNIYMGTHFTSEPSTLGLTRFILRVPINALPNGPVPSDLRGTTSTIESGDIFGLPNGQTRSKHYSNMRLKDWRYIGATSATAGMWVVRDNNEGNSGGPFYRSLLNQATSTNQELTYIVNYGEAQTEAFRTNILNQYTLVFNDGSAPSVGDTAFLANMGMVGYVPDSGRGRVAGVGITGRVPNYEYTVGFANATAQYWTKADPVTGHFDSPGMLPGTYTMTVYKNEYAVESRGVTVTAGGVEALNTIAITGDPSAATPLWRIGDWDGTPTEFINGDKLTTMHPQDVRMASWVPPDYVVGTSTPSTGFPAYQWKDVNGTITIKFNLKSSQIANYQLRLGMTVSYAGGRPKPQLNGWVAANPAAPNQPKTRTLTVGTYRGNNTMYTFNIPASELVVGQNVLTLTAISGSSGVKYLSPGYAYDAVDFIKL